jgi:hypothetical protein
MYALKALAIMELSLFTHTHFILLKMHILKVFGVKEILKVVMWMGTFAS